MIVLPIEEIYLSSLISCFTASDLFDSNSTDLSAIESPSIDNLKLVTSYAVSAFVNGIMQQLQSKIDELDSKLSAAQCIDSHGNFYMPTGIEDGKLTYRMLSTYIEQGTDEPLVEVSKSRYMKDENGDFLEVVLDE